MIELNSSISKPRLTLAATLAIGLGGTGAEVIRHLKQRVRTSVEPKPGIFDFLVVDTVPRQNPIGKERLDWQEYAYIGDYVASEVLAHLDRYPEIREWWPFQSRHGSRRGVDRKMGAIHSGARQRRPIGRLSFFRKYYEFNSRLAPKLRNISSIVAKEELQRAGHDIVRNKLVRVYIVSSLCGGTGAGIFLDVALKLRKELRDQAYITGVFILPAAFTPVLRSRIQQRRVQANAYASLLELNHYMNTGREIEVNFPGEPAEFADRPFDRVYLVENVNLRGEYLDQLDDVHRMIAQEIYLEAASPVGAEHWNRDVNLTEEFVENKQGGSAVMAYSSFATASLVLPISQIQARAIGELVDELWLKGIVTGELLRQEDGVSRDAVVVPQVEKMIRSLEKALSFSPSSGEGVPTDWVAVDQWDVVEAVWDRRDLEDEARREVERVLEGLVPEVREFCVRQGMEPTLDVTNELVRRTNSRIRELDRETRKLSGEIERCTAEIQDLRGETVAGARRRDILGDIWGGLTGRGRGEVAGELGEAIALLEEQIARCEEQLWLATLQNEAWECVLISLDFLAGEIGFHVRTLRGIAEEFKEESRYDLGAQPALDQVFDLVSYINDPGLVSQRAEQILGGINVRSIMISEHIREYLDRFCKFERSTQERQRGNQRFTDAITYARQRERKHPSEITAFVRVGTSRLCEPELRRERIVRYLREQYRQIPRLRGAPEDPLRLLFDRCHPFWNINPDLGFSEGDMEVVALVGVDIVNDESRQLFEDHDFDLVSTGNSERIDLSHSQHGLPLRYLGSIKEYRYCYDELRRLGEVLHVHKDWEKEGLETEL